MMKILQKILEAIGLLIFALILFILVCYFNPDLSKKVGDFFQNLTGEQTADEEATTGDGTAATEEEQTGEAPGQAEGSPEAANTGVRSDVLNKTDSYQPVSEDSLQIPDKVAGKSDYEPVQDNPQEIGQDEGDKLQQELGYGETGEGLDFDAVIYPYYAMLDDDTQSLYRQLYANANALNKSFAPIVTTDRNGLKNAFMAVTGDHPELFWVDTAYSCRMKPDGTIAEIDLQFNRTADNINSSRTQFENAAAPIISGAEILSSDYDREVFVHDNLLSKITYNKAAPMNQSAYSAMVNGQTVCAGYARAFQYIMQNLGVPCYYCTGFAGENHAWNIIGLEDGFYNVDTTWDDTDPNTHDYFNGSDADFAPDHVRKDLSVYLPPCNGEKYRKLLASPEETPETAQDTGNGTDDTKDGGTGSTGDSDNTDNTGETDSSDETTTTPGTAGDLPAGIELPAVDGNGMVAGTSRSLQDAGYSQSDVLADLQSYYNACYEKCMANTDGVAVFQTVLKDKSLWEQVYGAYNNNSFLDGYGNKVIEDKKIAGFLYYAVPEALSDGYYLVYNVIDMRY